jgi:arylsulfatase A-like enzyme
MSRKKRRSLIFIIILFVLCLFLFLISRNKGIISPKFAEKYNIILISIDTLRPDHLMPYGYSKDTSPNITAWANEYAYIMQNAYTLTPITYPSFTTLMTGVSPFNTHIYNNGKVEQDGKGKYVSLPNTGFKQIPDTIPTIASLLKNQGYATAAFGENYVMQNKYTNIGKDFDTYEVFGESNITEGITKKALNWMQGRIEKSDPFFLWVHYIDPHEEFTPRGENACLFNSRYCLTIQSQTVSALAQDAKDQEGCHFSPLSDDQIGIQETLYDGEIYQTDYSVGKLLSFIKENKLDKNSLIILYSDHGEGFDHNYYFSHSKVLYESSIKIMMMVSLPGTKAGGKKILTPVTNADLLPTLSEILGWSSNEGSSFAKLLKVNQKEESSPSEKPIFYLNENASKFAVRKGDYKYIYTLAERTAGCLSQQTEELYNVIVDPDETKNLMPEMPTLTNTLKNLLLNHLEKSKIIPMGNPTPNVTRPVTKEDQEVLKTIRDLGY